ncbi:MAG TPA: hypothetical protein VIV27_00070, partial [Halioglobus sp.]
IDENGVVIFSDTKPAEEALVETIVIDEQAPPSEQGKQRLQDMRETTDRMISDRMAREKHRAEMRQLEAQTEARQATPDIVDDYEDTWIYPGYYGNPVQRPWRSNRHLRPDHPIARPPMRPPKHLPPDFRPSDFDYPASLIRRQYDPKVREAFR